MYIKQDLSHDLHLYHLMPFAFFLHVWRKAFPFPRASNKAAIC
jgi:hypothetical protein